MNRNLPLMIAVSTSVLAAIAFRRNVDACPPGVAVHTDEPALPWNARSRPITHGKQAKPPPKPRVSLHDGTPGSHVIVRAIANGELACGKGSGIATVRVARGQVTVQVTGFDAAATTCIVRAIEQLRFARVEDEIARIAIEI